MIPWLVEKQRLLLEIDSETGDELLGVILGSDNVLNKNENGLGRARAALVLVSFFFVNNCPSLVFWGKLLNF